MGSYPKPNEPGTQGTCTRWRFGDHLYLDVTDFFSGLEILLGYSTGSRDSLKPSVCVEIGSARGKSACYMGMALKDNGRGNFMQSILTPRPSGMIGTEWTA